MIIMMNKHRVVGKNEEIEMPVLNEEVDWAWHELVERGVATEQELKRAIRHYGNSIDTINDILYVRTGYFCVDEMIEAEGELEY